MNETLLPQAELIAGYLKGTLSTEQESALSAWINQSPDNRQLFDLLTNPETLRAAITRHDEKKTRVINELHATIKFQERNQDKWWYRWRDSLGLLAAVVVVLLTVMFVWFNQPRHQGLMAIGTGLQEDIAPGSDQARLYLEDSLVVTMVDTVDGLIAHQSDGDVKVLKENGWLFYHNSHPGDTISYNALEIPRKGKFRVILPDGSRVWLNAASNLRYPVLFGNNFRRVQFSGEGYFEVTGLPATIVNPVAYTDRLALATSRPFLIDIAGEEGMAAVQVTGSRFNVRAYPDEDYIEVLSLEGTVEVSKGGNQLTLQRNQLGRIYRNGKTTVQNEVPPGAFVAWKDNQFKFDDIPLNQAMKAVERWYDVQTDYVGYTARKDITACFERDAPLSRLLHYLEANTGMQFKLQGHTITVIP